MKIYRDKLISNALSELLKRFSWSYLPTGKILAHSEFIKGVKSGSEGACTRS
jgi:hypothetical protein